MFVKYPGARRSRNPFKPDYIVDSVAQIDFKQLYSGGVRACLIDLDGTVVARGTYEVGTDIKKALKAAPVKVYIATNRPVSRDLKNLKEDLHANGVIHPKGLLGKPFKRYYAAAKDDLGLNKKELIMIGDRFLQDMYGANRAGLRTILVSQKIGPPHGLGDRLLSAIEQRIARRWARSYRVIT